MAEPIDVVKHIRVGGRTLCGLKLGDGTGVHAIPYMDVSDAKRRRLCETCLNRYQIQELERGSRSSRSNRARFSNSPRMR